jgi:cell division protein FtsQ
MWRRVSLFYAIGSFFLAIGLFLLFWLGYRVVKYHSFFQVQRVDLVIKSKEISPRLTNESLHGYTQGISGSVWFVSINGLVDAFSSLSWVQSVEVSRSFPNVIRVELQEREPIALWSDGRVLTADHQLIEVSDADMQWLQSKRVMTIFGPESFLDRLVEWQQIIGKDLDKVGLTLTGMRVDYGGSLFLDVCTLGDVGGRCSLQFVLPTLENQDKTKGHVKDAVQILRALSQQGQKVVRIDLRYPTGAAVVVASS